MDEEESIKQKKATEHQKMVEAKNREEQLKATLRSVLEEDAYNRIINVKLANSQLFLMTAQNLLAIYKRIGRRIKDKELLTILLRLKEENEKETSITFERK